ncbi:MAG: lambda exonuclease family protein [Candidatus Dormibacteria bacterium]
MIAQRTPEWFAQRAGKLTGSRFADLMAVQRTGAPTRRSHLITTLAVERITGQCIETYSNAAMQRGVELEQEALAAYEAHTGVLVSPSGFVQHPTLPYVGVSPDGLIDNDRMVEVKCPATMTKHAEALRTGAHAAEYHWQLQGQLWVCGRKWVEVVSYDPRFPPGLQLAIVVIAREDDAIEKLKDACMTAEIEILALVVQLHSLKEKVYG